MNIANYTKAITENFPFWSKVRRNPLDAKLTEFINVFGLELDDAEKIINYVFNQFYIDTADVNYISTMYKASLPMHIDYTDTVYIKDDANLLQPCGSFEEFYVSTVDELHSIINKSNPYVLIHSDNVVYFSKEYKNLCCVVNDKFVFELEPVKIQVWNMFDELGSLVSLKRLPFESNQSFKERIKDVYIHTPSSTKQGLINAISRELGLRNKYIWENTCFDYVIRNKNVLVNTITILYPNGQIEYPKLVKNDFGELVIKALNKDIKDVYITYACNFSIHDINNIDDSFIKKYFLTDELTANKRLRQKIRQSKPFTYSNFTYDQTYSQTKSHHVMRSKVDAKIDGFLKYNNMSLQEIKLKVLASKEGDISGL